MSEVCPTTGKPIRRVTTEWLLERQPTRYMTKCQDRIPLAGLGKERAQAKALAMIAKVEAYLKKHGPKPQVDVLDALRINPTTWATVWKDYPSRIKKKRAENVKGLRHVMYLVEAQ